MTAPDYAAPDPTTVESAFAFLATVIDDLSTAVPEHLDADESPDAACLLLHDLRVMRKKLHEIEAFAEAEAARRLPRKVYRFAGYVAERRGSGHRWTDWEHDRVAWALCRSVAVDPATGEINPDVVPIVDEVRSRLMNAASPTWRTTILAQYGIDPADYSTSVPNRRTVEVRLDVADEPLDAA